MGEVERGKKKVRVPRALSFTLSPASALPTRPTSTNEARGAKEASSGERVVSLSCCTNWLTFTIWKMPRFRELDYLIQALSNKTGIL